MMNVHEAKQELMRRIAEESKSYKPTEQQAEDIKHFLRLAKSVMQTGPENNRAHTISSVFALIDTFLYEKTI